MAEKMAAHVDISGTILQHKAKNRPVPLMPQLVQAMQEAGWEVTLTTTRWEPETARDVLRQAGVELDARVVNTRDKADTARELLGERPELDQLMVVDDRPDNLESVCEIDHERLRPMGFVGSGKYCPPLSQYCVKLEIELALSAPDLAEALGLQIPSDPEAVDLPVEEWAMLLPGLDHPCGEAGSGTPVFDHGLPLRQIMAGSEAWWEHAWPQVGWFTCEGCVWRTLVQSVAAAAEVDAEELLGDAESAADYTQRLGAASEATREQLKPRFAAALEAVVQGIGKIGADAAACRPAGRPMERRRVEMCLDRLAGIYGKEPWLQNARWKLEEAKTHTLGP